MMKVGWGWEARQFTLVQVLLFDCQLLHKSVFERNTTAVIFNTCHRIHNTFGVVQTPSKTPKLQIVYSDLYKINNFSDAN